jgi:methylmalonyl-CoA mutase
VESFLSENGRRPRILVCKLGQDGHDRGAKVISSAFADFGFDVDIAPMFQAPKEVVKQAIENDVHVIGISTQAAGHKTLIPDLMKCLNDLNVTNMIVVCGGNIPQKDHAHLHKAGVAAIFGPQNSIHDVASKVLTLIHRV